MSINDGGPAFPRHAYDGHDGMTLRDWFASQALAGMLADTNVKAGADKIAWCAYALADAMLRAREVKP